MSPVGALDQRQQPSCQGFYLLIRSGAHNPGWIGTSVRKRRRRPFWPDVSSGLINIVNPGNTETLARLQLRGPGGETVATVTRVLPDMDAYSNPPRCYSTGRLPQTTTVSISADAPSFRLSSSRILSISIWRH